MDEKLKNKTLGEFYSDVQKEFMYKMTQQNLMLEKSILQGGCARFYHPYSGHLIGEAYSINRYQELLKESSVETIIVYVDSKGFPLN